jgi:purine-nucleoside phosphorylase
MIERRSPTDKMLTHDASTIESIAGGPIDVAVILGSGLSSVVGSAQNFTFTAMPYDGLLGMPVASLEGHAGEALVGTWRGKRVLVFAGRVHLYQGFSAQQVTTSIRLASVAGARTIIVTNSAACIDPSLSPGDIMLLEDHLNLTGRNPLVGLSNDHPFIDMSEAYAPRLRALAKAAAPSDFTLHEGVYAGLLGPSFETPAEIRHLRTIGAHAVGMSTVLETILARSLDLDVLGFSVISNVAGERTTTETVLAQASNGGARLGDLIDALMPQL